MHCKWSHKTKTAMMGITDAKHSLTSGFTVYSPAMKSLKIIISGHRVKLINNEAIIPAFAYLWELFG
jgi:hypothetical protein